MLVMVLVMVMVLALTLARLVLRRALLPAEFKLCRACWMN
jgi:hypothetical protein